MPPIATESPIVAPDRPNIVATVDATRSPSPTFDHSTQPLSISAVDTLTLRIYEIGDRYPSLAPTFASFRGRIIVTLDEIFRRLSGVVRRCSCHVHVPRQNVVDASSIADRRTATLRARIASMHE